MDLYLLTSKHLIADLLQRPDNAQKAATLEEVKDTLIYKAYLATLNNINLDNS
jgi:hypothetical protein